ncbi:MAG TPA: hypothetical protein VM662_02605, partial [Sphingomonas sp.]|nr:hypothetical protein [Sphingomonas sp.]
MKVSAGARRALAVALLATTSSMLVSAAAPAAQEQLDRGLIAVPAAGGGNLVQWRLRAEDDPKLRFLLFRDGKQITAPPISATNFHDAGGTPDSVYRLQAVGPVRGTDRAAETGVWRPGYGTIP